MKLTIGMATYNDFDGVFFTVQSLRLYHDLRDTEILVVDNKGDDIFKGWCDYNGIRYERYIESQGTTQPRQAVFDRAGGEYVICIDSHVLLHPGALDKLWEGDCLIHGPMGYDNMVLFSTHMKDVWRSDMWGVWSDAVRENEIPANPFEIPMHGLGLFGCRRDSWLGFNPDFRGFGGEEGYIHEKFRKNGRRVICLPWMKWVHRFKTTGTGYRLDKRDRVRNYLIGFRELGLDTKSIHDHFGSMAKYEERKLNDEQGANRTRTPEYVKNCAAI